LAGSIARCMISKVIPKDVVVVEDELRHDEVVRFIKECGYERTPLILNVEGKRVAKNFISTRDRLCRYLGVSRENLTPYLASVKMVKDLDILDFGKLEEVGFRERKITLEELPILKYYPKDGGRYITAGVVIAPFNEHCNACIHRMMLIDKRRLVARLVKPRHTYLLWEKAVRSGRDLKIAVAIGVHPLVLFASATRVPEGMEFHYAKALLRNLRLYRAWYDEKLLIPPAEIVLFGRITADLAEEGPFVDLTGTYDSIREQPVIEIDEVWSVDDPIYYSITPASSEHQVLMGIPYEPLIYKSVSNVCKAKNVVMSEGGLRYFHAFVQIEKHSEGDGKNAIMAAFAAHHSLKHVVVVDDDIDIFNPLEVEYAIATRLQGDRDIVIIKGARGSSLDPSSIGGTTTKVGFDATKDISRKDDFERVVSCI